MNYYIFLLIKTVFIEIDPCFCHDFIHRYYCFRNPCNGIWTRHLTQRKAKELEPDPKRCVSKTCLFGRVLAFQSWLTANTQDTSLPVTKVRRREICTSYESPKKRDIAWKCKTGLIQRVKYISTIFFLFHKVFTVW